MKITWLNSMNHVKVALVVCAVLIAAASLVVSHTLINDLEQQEVENMEVWAEAMRTLSEADEATDLNLVLKVINGNNYIPVVVADRNGNVTFSRNVDSQDIDRVLRDGHKIRMNIATPPVVVDDDETIPDTVGAVASMPDSVNINTAAPQALPQEYITICYDESIMLKRLAQYPYVQLGIVGLFVVVAIFALLSSKRAEQNKVWVGLSRETAHQLGTPISSLMAWTEVLKETYPDDELLPEMETDVKRLQLIAERFSKIGSAPELKPVDLYEVIDHVVQYISRRTSDKVQMTCSLPEEHVQLSVCAPLFEWVIENLCKNAIDAMHGQGSIHVEAERLENRIIILIHDTGKGIAKSNFQNVFRPGFTTKKRGWGLGLSLAKRIVEEYHHGRIYVKSSEIGKGTTFCIEMNI